MYCMQGKVRYSEVDENCELTWDALIDYFQDCCVAQSEEMGIGITYLSDRRKAWVLNAWQICVNRLPVLNEEIIIETWPYAMKGLFGYRNFRMTDKEGNCLAYANSIWVFVDLDTGRPLKIPADIIEKYTYDEPLKMKEIERKIAFAKEYELDVDDDIINELTKEDIELFNNLIFVQPKTLNYFSWINSMFLYMHRTHIAICYICWQMVK